MSNMIAESKHITFNLTSQPNVAITSSHSSHEGQQLVRYGYHTKYHDLPPKQSFPLHIPRSSVETLQYTSLCCICLNPLKLHPSVIIPKCNHSFHADCIGSLEKDVIETRGSALEQLHFSKKAASHDQATCPLCITDHLKKDEMKLIEGCKLYFILKSNVKFSVSSRHWDTLANKRLKHEEEIVENWTKAAEMGNDRAMMNLAHLYNHGDCAKQSYEKAAFWYQKQIDLNNDARALFRLGRLYCLGQFFKQDNIKASSLFLNAAKQGYPKAQVAYAKLLLYGGDGNDDGNGVIKKDLKEAIKWIEEASERGSHEAKLLYGQFLVDENEGEKAFEVYQTEARKGVADAQFNLGVLCLNGYVASSSPSSSPSNSKSQTTTTNSSQKKNIKKRNSPKLKGNLKKGLNSKSNGSIIVQDYKKAILYFLLAADQNHMNAQTCLGHMFLDGLGCEKPDEDQALYWFDKAALQGDIDSQLNAASLHLKMKRPSTCTSSSSSSSSSSSNNTMKTKTNESKSDVEIAENYYQQAALHGSSKAQFILGEMLERKLDKRNRRCGAAKAMEWYLKAAHQGDIDAIMRIADMLFYGNGVDQCYLNSARWYKLAATKGNNSEAMKTLGYMFYHGLGMLQSYEEAERWYIKAAENGNAKAMYYLAKMFIKGIGGVNHCFENAAYWLKKASELGDSGAQFYLARLYVNGQGVQENEELAINWATKAANQGHDGARDLLLVLNQEEEDDDDCQEEEKSKNHDDDNEKKSAAETNGEEKRKSSFRLLLMKKFSWKKSSSLKFE